MPFLYACPGISPQRHYACSFEVIAQSYPHRTAIQLSKNKYPPHLLPVGKAVFSGVLKNIFVLHLFPLRSPICTPIFKKYLSSYIGLLKNPSEINPLRKTFSPLLYRNFFVSKLNPNVKTIFPFTTYANPKAFF